MSQTPSRPGEGRGAVRLLARDEARSALLVERCVPGTPLWAEADEERANGIAAEVLHRIWSARVADHPFRLLTDVAAGWEESIPAAWDRLGRPIERSLLDLALSSLRDLRSSQPEDVILHQDFHGGNLLTAEREPWLAIDPKPLVGEREFSLAPIIRSVELGHSRTAVVERLDRLSTELGLDRERARGWALGQAIAWSSGGEFQTKHVETARWLLQAG